jgi:hypothetical protein
VAVGAGDAATGAIKEGKKHNKMKNGETRANIFLRLFAAVEIALGILFSGSLANDKLRCSCALYLNHYLNHC